MLGLKLNHVSKEGGGGMFTLPSHFVTNKASRDYRKGYNHTDTMQYAR